MLIVVTRRLVERHFSLADSSERRRYLLSLQLLADVAESGARGHYVRGMLQVWEDDELVREAVEVAGGLGEDAHFARLVFERLTRSNEPVFPCHLADVIRDLATQASEERTGEPICPIDATIYRDGISLN